MLKLIEVTNKYCGGKKSHRGTLKSVQIFVCDFSLYDHLIQILNPKKTLNLIPHIRNALFDVQYLRIGGLLLTQAYIFFPRSERALGAAVDGTGGYEQHMI